MDNKPTQQSAKVPLQSANPPSLPLAQPSANTPQPVSLPAQDNQDFQGILKVYYLGLDAYNRN
jgi:hypothetical protein